MVSAVEDLLGERVRGEAVPAQVEISEERQVLKGPKIIFHSSLSIYKALCFALLSRVGGITSEAGDVLQDVQIERTIVVVIGVQ